MAPERCTKQDGLVKEQVYQPEVIEIRNVPHYIPKTTESADCTKKQGTSQGVIARVQQFACHGYT
jgi:hypothetical protein